MNKRLRLDDPEFARLFTEVDRSWFRLETLQHYDVSYEREPFDAFHSGRPMPHDPGDDEWTAMIRRHIAAGRILQRVHVITEPLTPYVEYELAWGYKAGIAGGEDIRAIACDEHTWPDGLPTGHDFWLLDDDLWIMLYDDEGHLECAERATDLGTLQTHREWRDAALAQSVPVADYLNTIPQLRTRAAS